VSSFPPVSMQSSDFFQLRCLSVTSSAVTQSTLDRPFWLITREQSWLVR